MNVDSTKNQKIKQQFVQREVMALISDIAPHLFSWEGHTRDGYASWEDWDNLTVVKCPDCGEVNSILHNETPAEGETDEAAMEKPWQCSCGSRFEDQPEEERQEIFEYWIVTEWLGEKLKAKGEPVFERWGGWIWGRCGTGQAILLDGVISDICKEMEILEGQAHEWKV